MENNIHEKVNSALQTYDPAIRKIIIQGLELSQRTGASNIAQRLYKELDQIIKGDFKK